MRTSLLLLIGMSLSLVSFSQKMAVTENGEEVILFEDGTWEYVNEEDAEGKEIPTNSEHFIKGRTSTFQLKSDVMKLGFWLDPKKWKFTKAETNDDAEYELQYKQGDLYGMIITEQVEIPLETLKYVALENAKSVAPDIKVVKEEYRTVNGLKVLMMQMDGTLQGIKFSYFGYYYSCSEGSVQFITYTSQNLMDMDQYSEACEDLLNGLSEI